MGWGENDRGVSFTFGPEIVSKYLAKHDMDLICRAHQVSTLCRAVVVHIHTVDPFIQLLQTLRVGLRARECSYIKFPAIQWNPSVAATIGE